MQACVKFGAVFRNNFFFILGAHPAPYLIEKGGFLSIFKRLGPDVNQSPPSSAEIRNKWSYNSFPPYTSSWQGQGQLHVLPFIMLKQSDSFW